MTAHRSDSSHENRMPLAGPVTRRTAVAAGLAALSAAAANGAACAPALALDPSDLVGDLQDRASELIDRVGSLTDALSAMDFAAAQTEARSVRDIAEDIQSELSGGIWGIAEIIPVYGGDVKGVKSLVSIVVDLADGALVPLCDVLAETPLESMVQVSGETIAVDTASPQTLLDTASSALAVLRDGVERFDQIGTMHIDQLQDAVDQVRDAIAPYRDKIDVVDRLIAAVPRLLAVGGSRVYLVVAQANCEIRSTGGFPGSLGLVTVENGVVSIGDFSSLYNLLPRDADITVPVTEEERVLFGSDISWYAGIMNYIPHFPRVCELWSGRLTSGTGIVADGIVALDPVFLQNLMGVLGGSVTTSDGTVIDGTNAAKALLNDVYLRYVDDNSSQDAFFSEAAQLVLESILNSLFTADLGGVLEVVKKAMETRRLTVWMLNEDDEVAMRSIGCSGELSFDPAYPVAGIYLGNETWGKIDWWLDTELEVEPRGDGEEAEDPDDPDATVQIGGTTSVSLKLSNTLTWDEVTDNGYVFGSGPLRRQDGDMVLRVWLFAPQDGSISNLVVGPGTMSDSAPTFSESPFNGLQVLFGIVQMLPGEELTITYDVTCPDSATEPLRLDVTPICHD